MNRIMDKIKNNFLTFAISLATLLALSVPSLGLQTALAAPSCNDNLKDSAICGIDTSSGGTAKGTSFKSVVSDVVSVLSYIVGVVAIIMVIVGGFRYITSGGDSGKVSSAKSSIVYALIGVAVAALAQFLVHYILHKASGVSS